MNNLVSPQVAKEKYAHREAKVLSFLLCEKFTTASIIHQLLDLKTLRSVRKLVQRMVQKGLVYKHDVSPNFSVFGITNEGIIKAQKDLNKIEVWSYFEPSKINYLTVNHALDIQKVHIACINLGLDFTLGKELGSRAKADKIPDAIIDFNGKKICIEVERTMKTKRRYQNVIAHYMDEVILKKVNQVLYVCPTESVRHQIKKVFGSIATFPLKNDPRKRSVAFAENHRVFFKFVDVDTIESYLEKVLLSKVKSTKKHTPSGQG